MSRSQASSTSSSAPSWLQEFISAVTNLAREHAARSDRTIQDLMERLDKQELRHQQVIDAPQKQVSAAGATPLPGAALPILSQPANHTVAYRHLPHRRSSRQIFLYVTSGLGKQCERTILSSRMDRGSQTAINWLSSAPACRQTCGQPWDKPFRPGTNWQTSWTKSLATFGDVALHRVKLEQRHQDHGETFDHFYVGLKELAADADLCGTCLNDRLTTRIMAGVASEDLHKKLLAINPFPRLEDVVARCRSEESATNTEAEFTRRPALAVNVVSVRRSALTSAGRSVPTTTPSPQLQPSTPPATKTVCQFCGGRPHQTRSECSAYGTKCTACNRLHHFPDVCESQHNPLPSQSQDTSVPAHA